MGYLRPVDVEDLVGLLTASPQLSLAWLDSWFGVLPPAYRNTLDQHAAPIHRLRAALQRFNADPPLPDGAIPMVVALEALLRLGVESAVVDRARQLLAAIVIVAPGAAPRLEDVFLDRRLTGAELFAARPELRARLVELTTDGGPPAIIVNGLGDAGKTHTRKLVGHVAQKTRAFRVAWVEIEDDVAADYTADWLIEELVHSLVPSADGMPPRREPLKRWIGDLAAWALKQFLTIGADRPLWIVIDGIRNTKLRAEVRAAVERVAALAATPGGALQLRLVLIDCDPAAILSTGCVAGEEAVAHLTVEEAKAFLESELDAASFAKAWAKIESTLTQAAANGALTTVAVNASLRGVLA